MIDVMMVSLLFLYKSVYNGHKLRGILAEPEGEGIMEVAPLKLKRNRKKYIMKQGKIEHK